MSLATKKRLIHSNFQITDFEKVPKKVRYKNIKTLIEHMKISKRGFETRKVRYSGGSIRKIPCSTSSNMIHFTKLIPSTEPFFLNSASKFLN